MTNTASTLASRYGQSKRPRQFRWWWPLAGLALVVALFLAWYYWLGPGSTPATNSALEADVSTTHVIDAQHSAMTFTINGLPDKEVACAINVQSEDFTVVGWKIVIVPPSEQRTRTLTETLRTTQRGTSGFVDECWAT